MHPPDFWGQPQSIWGRAWAPAGWLWRLAAAARQQWVAPQSVPVPVLCIGNLTVGGAGKTPVAMDIAARLRDRQPHLLGRGYRGRLPGPEQVDRQRHRFQDVGDEALLLATVAPTWIGRDRRSSAAAAVAAGAGMVVLDDGYQDPRLRKDRSLLVVDGGFGFGNGRVMPAGPLRESLAAGLQRADAVAVLGADRTGVSESIGPEIPILQAALKPVAPDLIAGRRVCAFCGIGLPAKFRRSLQEMGCRIVALRIFADHHPYRRRDIEPLLEQARKSACLVVTTPKDAVRVPIDLRPHIMSLQIKVVWRQPGRLKALLNDWF